MIINIILFNLTVFNDFYLLTLYDLIWED